MEVTSTLKLYHDAGDPEYGCWLESSGTYEVDTVHYVAAGNEPISSGEGNYHLVLKLAHPGNGPFEHPVLHSVHLGVLADPGNAAHVIVDIMVSGQRVGGGQVKLATAEQSTRPIPFLKR